MGKSIKETAVISQGAQGEPLLRKRQRLRLILRAVLWLAGAAVFSAAGSWLILGGVYRDILPFYAVAYVLAALMYFRCSGRLAADDAGTCIRGGSADVVLYMAVQRGLRDTLFNRGAVVRRRTGAALERGYA